MMMDSHTPPSDTSAAFAPDADLRARAARTIAIFGAGLGGQIAFRSLAREARVVAFVDNAEAKWGTLVCGVPVISPRRLQASWPDTVVVASTAAAPIADQLHMLGLARHRIQVFTPTADDLALTSFQTTIDDLQGEVTSLLGFSPDAGAPLRVVIFGAGAGGRDVWARIRGRHRVIAFADNDQNKVGTQVCGVPVIAPKTLTATAVDRIVVGSMYFDEIRGQLIALGIAADRVCAVDDLVSAAASHGGAR